MIASTSAGRPSPAVAPRPGSGRWWALVVSMVALSALLHLPSFFHQLYDPDEAAIAVQGMGLVEGGHLYTDVIDRKPPLAPWLYAQSFRLSRSRDLRPMHAFTALALAGAALLIAWDLARRSGWRSAWWGGGLFLLGVTAMTPQNAQSANFSPLALLPGVGAIVLARRGTWRAAVGAGVCVGLATLTRQSWAIGVVPAAVAAWVWADNRREVRVHVEPGLRGRLRGATDQLRGGGAAPLVRAGAVLVAALATVAAVGLTLPLGLFVRWVFTGNGSLLFGIGESRAVVSRAFGSFGFFLVAHLVLCFLVLARAGGPVDRLWPGEPARGEGARPRVPHIALADLDLWLWLAVGLLSVVAGLRFFGHYWMQVLPPLCLLAAPAVHRFSGRAQALLAGAGTLTAVIFFVLACMPADVHRLPDPSGLARLVDAHSKPHDRVAVWGSYPELFWASDRLPAGGLILTDFVVGKSAGRIEGPATLRDAPPDIVHDYVNQLTGNPPPVFVDTSPSGLRGYDRYPLSVLPDLAALVRTRYRRLAVVDGTVVYVLARPGTGG